MGSTVTHFRFKTREASVANFIGSRRVA